jgi:cobalt/nickel transport system permease protein
VTRVRTRTLLIAGAVLALVLAGFVSFYASQSPDGLEKVSADKGIDAKEKDHQMKDAPLADYGVEGVDNERLSGGLAGVIGVGATLVVGSGVFWVLRKRSAGA